MKCPVDDQLLSISDRQGIEIDYCPSCRGVWLDRGELDKLIEKSSSFSESNSTHRDAPRPERRNYEDNNRYDDDDYNYGSHRGQKKKKEGFLGDLFDF